MIQNYKHYNHGKYKKYLLCYKAKLTLHTIKTKIKMAAKEWNGGQMFGFKNDFLSNVLGENYFL